MKRSERFLTIPTGLCLLRLVGSLGLIVVVLMDQTTWFFVAFFLLMATDWLDGKLAIWLDQCSEFGAKLDSAADMVMYAVLIFAGSWWRGSALREEWIFIALALGSYLVSGLGALWKYDRWPSYHTRLAKMSWLLMLIAVVPLIQHDSRWPLRMALIVVTLANLEAILITGSLSEWRANVPSYWHTQKLRNGKNNSKEENTTTSRCERV